MRRRRTLLLGQEEDEMREWQTLHEETLTEDKNVVISGFNCKEVEVYIISPAYETLANIYLTSNGGGNIFGDPRVAQSTLTTPFIMMLRLNYITPYLWEISRAVSAYYSAMIPNTSKNTGYTYEVVGNALNLTELNAVSITHEKSALKAGTKIYVRGR